MLKELLKKMLEEMLKGDFWIEASRGIERSSLRGSSSNTVRA